MKKIANLMLKHIEKIIFAVTMIILIVLISIQLNSFKAVQKQIYEARVEAKKLQTGGAKKPVPAIDLSVFDMKIEIQEPWTPAYTAGDWKTFREGKDSRIFGSLRRPPATLSDSYQLYIEEYGAGSLFDPPLYVLPLDGKSNLLAFESPYAFYSPYNSDIMTSTATPDDDDDTPPGDDDDDDIPPPTKDFNPATLVRVYKVRAPLLKFYLSAVMAAKGNAKDTWDLSFKTPAGDKYVRIGDEIEGTGFTLLDVTGQIEEQQGFKKTVYTAVVAPKDAPDQTIKMKEGRKGVPNPHGETSYKLVYFYPKARKIRVADGETIKLKSPKKTFTYDVLGQGDNVTLVESPDGKEHKLNKFSDSEYKNWQRAQKP